MTRTIIVAQFYQDFLNYTWLTDGTLPPGATNRPLYVSSANGLRGLNRPNVVILDDFMPENMELALDATGATVTRAYFRKSGPDDVTDAEKKDEPYIDPFTAFNTLDVAHLGCQCDKGGGCDRCHPECVATGCGKGADNCGGFRGKPDA